jgi:hypothetical protein
MISVTQAREPSTLVMITGDVTSRRRKSKQMHENEPRPKEDNASLILPRHGPSMSETNGNGMTSLDTSGEDS